jgi:hypothetical protein
MDGNGTWLFRRTRAFAGFLEDRDRVVVLIRRCRAANSSITATNIIVETLDFMALLCLAVINGTQGYAIALIMEPVGAGIDVRPWSDCAQPQIGCSDRTPGFHGIS